MRKFLALVLALVMTMSLVTVGANAFTDDSQISDKEAVEVLSAMGILKGYDDGSYRPQNTLTRGAGAKIIAYLLLGQTVADQLEATYTKFDDVTDSVGLAPYIEWAAANGIVDGYGNGKFGPYNPLTEYAFGKMLLTALGYSSAEEGFTGAGWQQRVLSVAVSAGVFDGSESPSRACTRETAASFALNALTAYVVVYGSGEVDGSYYWNGIKVVGSGAKVEGVYKTDKQLWQFYKGLTYKAEDADKWGRPGHSWTYGSFSKLYKDEPLATYTEATKNCDIYEDTGLKKGTPLAVYSNGVLEAAAYTVADNTATYGAQGRLTEVYADRIVNIDTYLGYVNSVNEAKYDAAGHLVKDAYSDLYVYGREDLYAAYTEAYVKSLGYTSLAAFLNRYDGWAEGESLDTEYDGYVLVNFCQNADADGYYDIVGEAAYTVSQLTKIKGNAEYTEDIQDVLGVAGKDVTVNVNADLEDYLRLGFTYYFFNDQYGNVIGAMDLVNDYVVLDTLYRTTTAGKSVANGNVVFFDASIDADASIASIEGVITGADISEREERNGDYYYTVYTYGDENGAYALRDAEFNSAKHGGYTAGSVEMTVSDVRYYDATAGQWKNANNLTLQLSSSTQILLQTSDSPDGTFKAFVGYKDLPSFVGKHVEYILDDNGYVEYLYVSGVELSSRTVFIYDVTPITSEATSNPGERIVTLKALELKDGALVDTTIKVLVANGSDAVEAAPGTPFAINRVGLYDLVESGDGNYWLATERHEMYSVTKLTTDGNRVTIGVGASTVVLDNALIAKYEGSFEKGEVTTKDVTAKSLNDESIIFLQEDADGNVVAVYDMWIELAVKFADTTGVYENAKIVSGNTGLYFGKSMPVDAYDQIIPIVIEIPAYVDYDKTTCWDVMGDNDLWKANFTMTGDDNHDAASTLKITTDGRLYGDVKIFLKADPKHTSTWLKGVTPTTSNNLTVTVNTDGTITLSGTNTTPTVADLLLCLDAECDDSGSYCDHARIQVFDNTEANGEVSGDTVITTTNIGNLYVKVTAENGAIKTYTLKFNP